MSSPFQGILVEQNEARTYESVRQGQPVDSHPGHVHLTRNLLWLFLVIGAAGCISPEKTETFRDKGDVFTIRSADRALAFMERGLTAFRRGNDAEAARYFDKAMGIADGVVANDFKAKMARSYFYEEKTKTYIGEPYERALCFFYRGLLYWNKADYDNARACFRSAIVHGSQGGAFVAGDFVLFDYLEGFATYLLNKDASDELRRARAIAGDKRLPDYSRANLCLLIEVGDGPIKVGTGSYQQELRYTRPKCDVAGIRLTLMQKRVDVALLDDVVSQAPRHGRKEMNVILSEKARLKADKEQRAETWLSGGTITNHHWWGTTTTSGNLPGEVDSFIAENTKPKADTRCWSNLPQYLSFCIETVPPGPHSLQFEFLDKHGVPIEVLTQNLEVTVPKEGSFVKWIYTPGMQSGPSKPLSAGLGSLFNSVPAGREFPIHTQPCAANFEDTWEAVLQSLVARGEVGLQANKETGLILTGKSKHGIVGFSRFRQYLVEVRSKSPNLTEVRFVQLLYYLHVSSVGFGGVGGELQRETNEDVNSREKAAFLKMLNQKIATRQ